MMLAPADVVPVADLATAAQQSARIRHYALMAKTPGPYPVGVVGRVYGGRYDGFFVEIDDDTSRPKGTGGWYVLWWSGDEGYDDWLESDDDLPGLLSDTDIEWLSEDESAAVPGRHRHDSL